MHGEIEGFSHACVGDERSQATIAPAVKSTRTGLALVDLKAIAKDLVRRGTKSCGHHENGVRTCGGGPFVECCVVPPVRGAQRDTRSRR
jgi:hypothetical protein